MIGPRLDHEQYRMRSVAGGYPGDAVTRHTRLINGKRFEFSRIVWGDGTVSVSAWIADTTHNLHSWVSETPRECGNDGCHTPIRPVEDFCSDGCWEEWHAKHDPETLARATASYVGQ